MAATDIVTKQQEVWHNATKGMVAVIKVDRRGEPIHELVHGGQKLNISSEERLLNQDRAAEPELDVFLNGTLTPIRIVEGSEGAAEIANNPNLMSESDIKALLKTRGKAFEEKVSSVSNSTTLHRILATAEEEDASVRQVNFIKARLNELSPARFVERSSVGFGGTAGTGEAVPKAVTPK